MKTKLTKTQVKALASKDGLKPALCGALFEPEKSRLTVTNGHALISYPVEPGKDDNGGVIPVDLFATAKDAKNPSNEYFINGTAKRSCDGLTQETQLIEDRFPDYESVIPTGAPDYEIGFDLELIKQVADAMPKGNDGKKTVKLSFYGPVSAARFESSAHRNEKRITGVIMPVRLRGFSNDTITKEKETV